MNRIREKRISKLRVRNSKEKPQRETSIIKQWFVRNPALVISVTYIFLNFISFIVNYRYYSLYKIDYSQFVETNDLLFGIVKLGQDQTLSLILILIPFSMLIAFELLRSIRSMPFKIVVILKNAYLAFMLIVSILVIISMYRNRNRDLPANYLPEVSIVHGRPERQENLLYLGSSEKFHFFLSSDSTMDYEYRPKVLSASSVKSIEFLMDSTRIFLRYDKIMTDSLYFKMRKIYND